MHGSHSFYGAEYGHRVTARELSTGRELWSTELPEDTGYQNHQIVDLDFDGRLEIVAFASNEYGATAFALDGDTGEIVRELDGGIFGSIPEEEILLVSDNDYFHQTAPSGVTAVNAEGHVVYQLPEVSFGVRFVGDERYRLVNLSYEDEELTYDVYDATTGAKEQRLVAGLTLPVYENVSDYGVFGPPPDDLKFSTLADTDGDGYWNALIQIRDFVIDVALPIAVHPSYDPYAPIAFRNVSNAGSLYD